MNAAAGYLLGFDGLYEFDAIGDKYADYDVPYIGMRALPAGLNVLNTALIFGIMNRSGYATITCMLTAAMYLLGIECYLVTINLVLTTFTQIMR